MIRVKNLFSFCLVNGKHDKKSNLKLLFVAL